jgi:hypothetical protein
MTVHTSPTGFKRGGDANSDLKDDQSGEDDSSACSVSESSTSGKVRFFFKNIGECEGYTKLRNIFMCW